MAYGYVRDKEPLGINWAEISKNFNDRLAADEAERQGKRDDIQKQYDELSQELIDKPTGADIDLNSAISSFSTQASQASLDALNRLKRGEISEQEYYNRRANLKSSTSNLFLYANNFNSQLEENLKLIQSQDPDNQGSGRMAFQMALAQDMLNFKNTVAIIDPATDEVMLVKTDEEGNPTNEVVSVSQLGNLSSQKENSYNYKGRIARALENRGVAKYTKDGKVITTIQGVDIKPGTATATIDKLAESFVGDESQILSILYQNGYQYTQDESLKGKDKYIYYDIKNGTYDYDKDKAVEFVKEDINNSIPVEVKDELTTFQKANIENQRLNREESIRQFNIKIALDRERLGIESGNQEGVNSPLNIIQTTDGRQIAGNNYVRTISKDNFKNFKNKKDVSINLTEVLKEADIPGVTITYTEGGQDVSPITDLVKSQGGLTNVPMGHLVTGSSSNPTIRTLETIDIFVPEIMDQPIRIPITETISEDIERVLTIIELRKEGGDKIIGNEISFIPFNEFYNPISRQEEEVVEEVDNKSVNNSNRATGFNPD